MELEHISESLTKLTDGELLLMNKQRISFLEIDYIPGIDDVMTVEMTKK